MNLNLSFNEGEMAVIGALFIDNKNFELIEHFTEEHFVDKQFRNIFKRSLNAYKENNVLDLITYNQTPYTGIENDTQLIIDLMGDVGLAVNLEKYANHLHDLKIKRDIQRNTFIILKSLETSKIEDIEENFSRLNYDIQNQKLSQYKSYDQVLQDFDLHFNEEENENKIYKTGFGKLDNFVKIKNGNTYIIGAGTGMGKSTFTQVLAINLAKQGLKGCFLSLEMSANDMIKKQISNITEIPFARLDLNYKYRTQEESDTANQALSFLKEHKQFININDTFDIHIRDLKKYAREERLKGQLDFLVVDQISLINNSQRDERLKIKETSWELRKLAKELDIPIFILTQLNRQAEVGTPQLAHIAESSAVAFDTSAVMLIDAKRVGDEEDIENDFFDLHVVKNRFGTNGIIKFKKNWDICKCYEVNEYE